MVYLSLYTAVGYRRNAQVCIHACSLVMLRTGLSGESIALHAPEPAHDGKMFYIVVSVM